MSRIQLALNVDDLGTRSAMSASATLPSGFYSKLFATEPAKVRVDGPSGEPWEIYTVLENVEMPAGQLRTVDPETGASCCAVAVGDEVEAGSTRCC